MDISSPLRPQDSRLYLKLKHSSLIMILTLNIPHQVEQNFNKSRVGLNHRHDNLKHIEVNGLRLLNHKMNVFFQRVSLVRRKVSVLLKLHSHGTGVISF